MDEPIDGGHGGHRVLEDLIPLTEDQVGGDQHRALPLVAFGEEGEEHLHLVLRLTDVAEVVADDGVEAMEFGEQVRQFEIAFGDEQLVDELEGRHEEDLQLVALDQFPAERGAVERLAAAGQAEGQKVVAPADKIAGEQAGPLSAGLVGQLGLLDQRQVLAGRQRRVFEQAFDAPAQPLVEFRFRELMQEPAVAPVLGLGADDGVGVVASERGQPERTQEQRERVGAHALTSVGPCSWS